MVQEDMLANRVFKAFRVYVVILDQKEIQAVKVLREILDLRDQ